GDDVKIGQRVKIYSQAHILNGTCIGDDCQIHMGVILGHLPQIRENISEDGRLSIGQRNIFREYATVHRSNQKEKATVIGNDNYFMAFSHIAHDCNIASHVTICNGALMAGHVTVQDYVFISGNVTVHQFCRIGKFSMVGGLARVAKDVPPYMLLKGDSTIWAVNSVGLRRAKFSPQVRTEIKKAFKLVYKSGLNVRQAIEQLQKQTNSCEVKDFINFILDSQRGICGHKRPRLWERIRLMAPAIRHRQFPAYRLFQNNRKGQELDV
ncbi:MAG: acyl-ACP--UDP-N-acetylglucosamine O-acyltransferase, partial [Candidatus Omnitrophica bacterium]|nr:acyl-ACP--UDP-N-acetylglucosamine O-acyltransferase [Candidatus Omnitrophota bacterium]